MSHWIVVGAGLSGSVFARELAESGKKVEVFEVRNHVSGNCYDPEVSGIRVHKHGPHFFHTNSEKIWRYVNKFSLWRPYEHKVKGIVDGIEVPIPINFRSLELLFPSNSKFYKSLLTEVTGANSEISIAKLLESDIPEAQVLAQYIYDKVFLGYSRKQWGINPLELNASVLSRVPIRANYDERYFTDQFQALPEPGYLEFVNNLLDHKNIKLRTNQKFSYEELANFKDYKIAYTGALDELLNYKFGELPYRSLHFEYLHLEGSSNYFSAVQTNFPNNQEFTRITDYGRIWNRHNHTVLAYEYPKQYEKGINERYYPIPQVDFVEQHKKYKNELRNNFSNVITLGRLADYKYYNMDQAIAHSLQLSNLYST
jgi:UDP-galactopyranose mutase